MNPAQPLIFTYVICDEPAVYSILDAYTQYVCAQWGFEAHGGNELDT
jgi:hypothetical protein